MTHIYRKGQIARKMQDEINIEQRLAEMAGAISAYCAARDYDRPLMVGILRGGAWIARNLHEKLALAEPLGELDITFYRDDFSMLGLHPEVKSSRFLADLDDRHIILVDDVLYTGRTVRAALNELFDYGRPASVTLVVLIERPGRELPVQADIVGEQRALKQGEHVKLKGPSPLVLEIKSAG